MREVVAPVVVFQCEQCPKSFESKRVPYMRSAVVHGRRPKVNFLTGGSYCPAYQKENHVRPRLIAHLQYSQRCAYLLESICSLLAFARGEASNWTKIMKLAEGAWPDCELPELPPPDSPEH